MIRHIPCQPAHKTIGIRRARVLEHVGDKGTTSMFSEQIEPQGRCADQGRNDPQPKHDVAPIKADPNAKID